MHLMCVRIGGWHCSRKWMRRCHPRLDLLMVEVKSEGEWKVDQNEGPLISEEKRECVGVKAT